MKRLLIAATAITTFLSACNSNNTNSSTTSSTDTAANKPVISEEIVVYTADSITAKSFVAFDKSKQGPLPVVLVIPEWWGLTEYPKMRARELAKLGYLAMAVDMYGGGRTGDNPDVAGKLAMPFYADTTLIKSRLSAALAKATSLPQADKNKVAIIGYCFGGSMSLMGAKLGLPVRGAVSIHGNLKGTASKTVPILVCHGEADKFVTPEEVATWRKAMDSLGATYTFKSYPNATHAFSNPQATETGKKFNLPISYNGAADTASWNDMKAFFGKIF